jgi:hypothetical protein
VISCWEQTPAAALPKLLLQTTILFNYLREGFPPTTIFFYASLLVLNWMITMYCAIVQLVDPRAALVRVFYRFGDLRENSSLQMPADSRLLLQL